MPKRLIAALALLVAAGGGWFAVRTLLNPFKVSTRSPLGIFSRTDRLLLESGLARDELSPEAAFPRTVVYTAPQEEHGGQDTLSLQTDAHDRIIGMEASFLMRPETGDRAMGPPLATATFVAGYWNRICGSPSFEHFDTGGGAPSWGPFDQAWFGSEGVTGTWTRNPLGQGSMDELWTLNDVTISLKETSGAE